MNIILFGGTSGLGKKIYQTLSDTESFITVVVRNKKKFDQIKCKREKTRVLEFDLCDSDNLFNFLNQQKFDKKFDSLIYSVGIETTLPLKLSSIEKIKEVFNINFFSAFESLKFFSQKSISNNGSSIVFISSIMSELGSPGKSIYCSSKSALTGLIKSCALELAKRHIRVNSISPSIINNSLGNKLFSNSSDKESKFYASKHILGLIEEEDVVSTIEFLISEKSNKITGQNILLDSGYSVF